ncbi:MAG: sulfurtransferase [Betaproteobacteria bacterium]|nr:sulfurtransferase [Betaproteobacteria bacterium]
MLATSACFVLAACGGGGEDTSYGNVVKITVNTPQMIAQSSADNYDQNVNGLITAATLKSWISNWTANRPAGITGKLVIFQATAGPAGAEYIKPNNTLVYTYLSPSSEWVQTRINGVIETQSMVPDGPTMDALLKKYNVNPQTDMIVCAQGTGSTGNAMSQGRCWYALRYWGVDRTNVSVLNGGNQWLNGNGMVAADFVATASTAPGAGGTSVRDIPVDNTALQATFEDLMAVLPASDTNQKDDGVMIWDARSVGQFSAGERLEAVSDSGFVACGSTICPSPAGYDYMRTFQNSGSRQGHPRGTLQLQYTNLLDGTKGYSYKPKSELANYLAGGADAAGYRFIDATYGAVGQGSAYQSGDVIYAYCETTFRAMITGFASAGILGLPVRFYDGAMVEWNSLSNLQDRTGAIMMPADSPWRTDAKSFFRPATPATAVATRNIVNPYATHANKIILEDQAYKRGEPGGGTAGSSGSGGGNPCG